MSRIVTVKFNRTSGQSSWLQIHRSGFDFRPLSDFPRIVTLERSPLSLVSSTEELLVIKSSCFSLEIRK
jgi:hypothetical protein